MPSFFVLFVKIEFRSILRIGCLLFCLNFQASFSQASFFVNPEWFKKSESASSTAGKSKNRSSSWVWQSNTQLLSSLAYTASGVVYDYHFFKNTNLGPMDGLGRCPRPDGETPSQSSAILRRVKDLGYCQTKIGSGPGVQDAGPDFLGSQLLDIRQSDLFKNNFLERTNGDLAFLADSYAVLPIAHRRQALAALTQIWDKERASRSANKCQDFRAKENIIESSVKVVSAPAVYYDCAYKFPRSSLTAGAVPFVPRDRGVSSETAEDDAPECISRSKLFFLGPNCSGQALVFLPMETKRLDIVSVRDSGVNFSDTSDSLISPLPAAFNTLQNFEKAAFFTEVLDRTIYSPGTGEVFQRAVEFTNDPVGTSVNASDLPNMRLYFRGPNSSIKSFYRLSGSGVNCVNASGASSTDLPTAGDGTGYYGYLTRIPGKPANYSGFIARHYRDVYVDEEIFKDEPNKNDFKRFLIRNDYPALTYNRDIPPPPPPAGPVTFSDETKSINLTNISGSTITVTTEMTAAGEVPNGSSTQAGVYTAAVPAGNNDLVKITDTVSGLEVFSTDAVPIKIKGQITYAGTDWSISFFKDAAPFTPFVFANANLKIDYRRSVSGPPAPVVAPPVDPRQVYPLARLGPRFKLAYSGTVINAASYETRGLSGCGGTMIANNVDVEKMDKLGTCYLHAGNPNEVASTATVQISEYWSEDRYSDSTGAFPVLLCDPGSTLLNIGRNKVTFDDRLLSATGTLSATAKNACIRFPISRRTRATGADDAFGPAGNPLSDLSFLSFGAAGSAMFCRTDIGTLSEGVSIPNAITPLAATDTNSYVNPESGSAVAMALPAEANKRFLLDYLASKSVAKDRVLRPEQFFNAQTNTEMSIGTRAMFLGDEARGSVKNLPINWGRCAIRRTPLDSPLNSMGPLAIPMQNYLIELVIENSGQFPLGTPPNCANN